MKNAYTRIMSKSKGNIITYNLSSDRDKLFYHIKTKVSVFYAPPTQWLLIQVFN